MGIFVTIDGPNGVGKSTFIKKLKERLEKQYTIYLTKEPSESKFGKYVKVNEELLRGEAYAYLIAADRCYHIQEFIIPQLDKVDIVVSDRYIESSLVLQSNDGVELEDIWRLNCKFMQPDLNIVLLASEDVMEERLSERLELSHFEKLLTRKDEINGYLKSVDFLQNKGFNMKVMYNNTQDDFENNLDECVEIIKDLKG